MRTTLDIDDDVLEAAKELARREKKSAGAVLSRLAREALTGARPESLGGLAEAQQMAISDFDFPLLPRRPGDDRVVTTAMIERVRDAIDAEEVADANRFWTGERR